MTPARTSAWVAIRPACWIMLAFAGIFVLLLAGHYRSVVLTPVVLGLQIAGVLILGIWLAVAVKIPAARPRTPLLLPVLVCSAGYVMAAILSQRPRLSLEPTLGGLGFALAFLFLSQLLRDSWMRERAGSLLVLITTGLAAGYIAQVVVIWIDWWLLVGRLTLPPLRPSWAGLMFGSPNVLGSFFLLAGPVSVSILWSRNHRRTVVAGLAGIVLLALFLTGSRGAYLGAGITFAVGLALVSRGRRDKFRDAVSAVARQRWIVAIAILVVAIAAALLPALIYRLGTGGEAVRLDLWRSALTIFSDLPMTGGGPGTWVQLKVEANPPGVPNYIFNNAHNMYLQAAAEVGVIGLASMLLLAAAVSRRLLSTGSELARSARWEAAVAFAAIVGFGGQLMVENQLRLPAICLLLAAIVAWVDAGLPDVAPGHGYWASRIDALGRGRTLPILGLVGVLGTIPVLVQINVASDRAVAGAGSATFQDWAGALTHYDDALAKDPAFTLYAGGRASALARLGRLEDARSELLRVFEADPIALNQIGLAVLDLELGDVASALERARLAMASGVGEPTVALNAGLIAERAGNAAAVLDAYANAIAWAPSIASDPFWRSDARPVSLGAIIDEARSRSDGEEAGLIAAYAGLFTEALDELERLPPSSRRDVYIGVVRWLSGDVAGGRATLEMRLDANALDWTAAAWLSRLARLSGDAETGYRYAKWAVTVQGDTAPSVLFEESIVTANTEAARTAGYPKGYPTNVYVRSGLPFLQMPQLVLVGIR